MNQPKPFLKQASAILKSELTNSKKKKKTLISLESRVALFSLLQFATILMSS